jgi:hypothetical protein
LLTPAFHHLVVECPEALCSGLAVPCVRRFALLSQFGQVLTQHQAKQITDVELFVLSRKTFNAFANQHKKAAANLFEGLASVVTTRVRYLTSELVELES